MKSQSSLTSAPGLAVASVVALGLLSTTVGGQKQRFYPDDPIARYPYTQDASKVMPKDPTRPGSPIGSSGAARN
jgi:hypothetical protein